MLRILPYAGLTGSVCEEQAVKKKILMKLQTVVALSANKTRRRKSWDGSPSHSSKQPATDGEMVHVGTGTVAVLWGKFF